MKKPDAVGLAWYKREDYGRILKIMEDADTLPATYDRWLKAAETGERELTSKGHVVVRAIIDPDEFVAWCAGHDLKVDSKARQAFAAEFARRGLGKMQ